MVDELYLANAALELASGVVALLVSYTAFRYNRLLRSEILGFLSFGFMLLGVGLLAEGSLHSLISFNIGQILEDRAVVYVASVIYLILQLIAYSTFTIGYYRGSFGRVREEGVLPALIFIIFVHTARNPLLLGTYVNATVQLIVVLLLAFIVFQGLLVHGGSTGRSALVLGGFLLILIAHALVFVSSLVISPPLYLGGALVQFAGFLSLLAYILRSGRVGATSTNP